MKLTIVVILIFLAVGAIFYIYFYQPPAELPVSSAGDGTGASAGRQLNMKISSSAFENNGLIPAKYTCNGEDINPPLFFADIPDGTESLALIAEDPDAPAGTWVHWLLWNIPPETGEIGENSVPEGALSGVNDFVKNSYGGPCPPSGTHRYFFKLYALDKKLSLPEGARKEELEKAMEGSVLDSAELVGLYGGR